MRIVASSEHAHICHFRNRNFLLCSGSVAADNDLAAAAAEPTLATQLSSAFPNPNRTAVAEVELSYPFLVSHLETAETKTKKKSSDQNIEKDEQKRYDRNCNV